MCILSTLSLLIAAEAIVGTLALATMLRSDGAGDNAVMAGLLVALALPVAPVWDAVIEYSPAVVSSPTKQLLHGGVSR